MSLLVTEAPDQTAPAKFCSLVSSQDETTTESAGFGIRMGKAAGMTGRQGPVLHTGDGYQRKTMAIH